MDHREARRRLGSRSGRRAGTKRHTLRLSKVQGTNNRATASELRPPVRIRLRELLASEEGR